ncbi:Protein of unknown function [Amycolatopsis xylanica]|uniref:DUF742 domain-containing protein n=1 Tax=Amycolatopsis xylanica TaxID=589385 RepID=A0A1H3A8T9_9PSEU|nr:DUF742 domain-containing protein [Amycolatopsis xylanica]SDX26130.1 Protein of unknown function [Amycolatopsis xylanica]
MADDHEAKMPDGALVGARFPSDKLRARFADEEPVKVAHHRRRDAVGRVGARFPAQQTTDEPVRAPVPSVRKPEPAPPPEYIELPDSGPRVRPYVLTRGRTKPKLHLAIEAMISTRVDAPWAASRLSGEFHSVRSICERPRSVAEIAANLAVPLGVARVLLGDMAELGLVNVHETSTTVEGRPALAMMERVLRGLQRL